MNIEYLKGDATVPQSKGNKIIAHICNNIGGWGKGFVLAISKRWPEPEASYRLWHRERNKNDFELGAVKLVEVEKYIWVCNMISQQGIKTGSNGPPIRYETLKDCLSSLAVEAKEKQASVHMPRIGCGLAGGKWDKVEVIIQSTLIENAIPVYIYDF